MDNFDEIFGSDSDNSQQEQQQVEQQYRTQNKQNPITQGSQESFDAQGQVKQYEKQQNQYQEQQRKALLEDLEDSLEDSDSQKDQDVVLEEQIKQKITHYDIPEFDESLQEMKDSSQLFYVQTSNLVGIDHTPFDPETFEVQNFAYQDDQGRDRVLVRDKNVVRWRYQRLDDGTYQPETNARIVEWSNGQRQLLIGDQVFNMQEQDMSHQNNFLFQRAGPVIQGLQQFYKKMVLAPSSIKPSIRRQGQVSQQNKNKSYMGEVVTIRDPEKENIKLEQEYQKAQKERELLNKKRQRTMHQSNIRQNIQTPQQKLSAAFLEQEDEEDYEVGRHLDYDKEAQGEQRILKAQQLAQPQKQTQVQQPKAPDVDDEEEFESVSEENKQEDEQPNKKAKVRKGVIFDDDDEDDDF